MHNTQIIKNCVLGSLSSLKMHFILYLTMALHFWFGLSEAVPVVSKTIYVNRFGHGNFTKVQQAIDSVPSNNKEWIRIFVRRGHYDEKITIPGDKEFILLEGQGKNNTIIQWDDVGSGAENATLSVLAQNFVAKNIQFRNSYNKGLPQDDGSTYWDKGPLTWTTAVYVGADKVSFYNCSFYGQQDTLNDALGRHYFDTCYIEGLVDFIWGYGQSVYQNCEIYVNAKVSPNVVGYITAQGRYRSDDPTGFVFISGSISGNGKTYLGRAYREHSRVLFYKTYMSNVVLPQGWDAWHYKGNEKALTFSEEECTGDGAGQSKRVKWEKKLSEKALRTLTSIPLFIDQDGWLKEQP